MTDPNARRALMGKEEQEWNELHGLIDGLPADRVDEPGYFAEGWSANDLIAHIGSWLAEAGVVLEQIRAGTYRSDELDIDEMNARFYTALHDVPFPVVKAQAITARNQMLRAWARLPEDAEEAERWISKSGPEHYEEHLADLAAILNAARGMP